jgi:hypothetical protein
MPKIDEEVDLSKFAIEKPSGNRPQKSSKGSGRGRLRSFLKNHPAVYLLIIAVAVIGIFIELKYFYFPPKPAQQATEKDFEDMMPANSRK